MKSKSILNRIVSLLLVVSIFSMLVSCSTPAPTMLSDATPQTITENLEIENTIDETALHEFITEEIYLQELVICEDKITELLLDILVDTVAPRLSLCPTLKGLVRFLGVKECNLTRLLVSSIKFLSFEEMYISLLQRLCC